MPAQTRDPRTLAATSAAEWLAPLELRRPEAVEQAAIGVACHFAGEPRRGDSFSAGTNLAYADLQPGNGTAYRMVIALLPEMIRPALGFGLTITLPDFHVGLALDPFGFHVPWYIAEKAPALGAPGHAILAAFTTLLSAHLDHLLTP